ECETNIDPQDPPPGYDPQAACTAVTAESAKHRRPFASGPGIMFGAVPIDVMASDVRQDLGTVQSPGMPPAGSVRERNLTGTFAWVITSSGNVYLMTIDPVPRSFWFIPENAPTTTTIGTTTCTDPGVANATPCDAEPLPPVNTLRNNNVLSYSRALDPNSG